VNKCNHRTEASHHAIYNSIGFWQCYSTYRITHFLDSVCAPLPILKEKAGKVGHHRKRYYIPLDQTCIGASITPWPEDGERLCPQNNVLVFVLNAGRWTKSKDSIMMGNINIYTTDTNISLFYKQVYITFILTYKVMSLFHRQNSAHLHHLQGVSPLRWQKCIQ
jgi:hypothetical protein